MKRYSFENGVPDNYVYDLIQDTTGIMWFTSRSGIFSYDASEWKSLEIKDTEIAPFKYIVSDETGNLWVLPENTSGFILFYNYTSWQKIPLPQLEKVLDCNSFTVINNDLDRIIAIGTNEGLVIFHNGKWQKFTIDDGLPNNYIFSTNIFRKNDILIATMEGLAVFNTVNGISLLNNIKLPGKAVFATYSENSDSKNIIWLLGNNWVGYITGNKFHNINRKFDFPVFYTPHEYFITSDHQQRLYLGNQIAAFWIDRETGDLSILSDDQGIIREGATNAFVDREQNVWFSSKRGIHKIRKSVFVNYYASNGLLDSEVSAIEGFGNRLLLGHNNGITVFDEKVVKKFEFKYELPAIQNYNRILDMYKWENHVYFAASKKGAGSINEKLELNWFKTNPILTINTITCDQLGKVWFGSNKGLHYLKGNEVFPDDEFNSQFPSYQYIRKIIPLPDTSLAITTTTSGLILKKGSTINKYLSSEYLTNSTYDVIMFRDTLLVGTASGLYYLDENKFIKFKIGKTLISSPVYFLKKDADEHLWIGINKGLYRFDGLNLQHFGEEDGLSGPETNRSAAYVDQNDNFWVGTNKGLSFFTKEYSEQLGIKPKIILSRIESNSGLKFNPENPITLESTENTIWIHYKGLSFIDETMNSFSVILHNLESEDSEEISTREEMVRFANLEPGEYYIAAKILNSKGVWSDPVKSAVITINKPFYAQMWFYVLAVFFSGIIFFLILDTYSNKKYSKELERKVAERTRELEKSEKKYRQLVETAIDGIISTDRDFAILTWNNAAENIYGFTADEVLGKNYFEVTKSELKNERYDRALETFFTTETWKGEVTQHTKTGTKINVLIAGSVYKAPNGEVIGMVGICRDITELKQLEKNKTLAVLESLEKERNRISRDLHDDLGQILSSAKMKLEVFEYKAATKDEFVNDAIELIGHAGTELRNIVHDLHPAEIERYGLLAAIDLLIFQMQKLSGVNIYLLKKHYTGGLNKKDELMVYRIVQESLNNAIKHAKADQISVSMEEIDRELNVVIIDKGVGFDPGNLKLNREEIHGYGLLNMFQRADMIGAELKIKSEPGKGTEILIKIRI